MFAKELVDILVNNFFVTFQAVFRTNQIFASAALENFRFNEVLLGKFQMMNVDDVACDFCLRCEALSTEVARVIGVGMSLKFMSKSPDLCNEQSRARAAFVP